MLSSNFEAPAAGELPGYLQQTGSRCNSSPVRLGRAMGKPDLGVTAERAGGSPEHRCAHPRASARAEAGCVAARARIPRDSRCYLSPGPVPIGRHGVEEPGGSGCPPARQVAPVLSPGSPKPQLVSCFWKAPARVGKVSGGGRGGKRGGWDFPQEITGGTLAGGWGEPARSCYIMPQ